MPGLQRLENNVGRQRVSDSKRTWETQDPRSDADLIDPGPIPGERPLRKDERAIRQALIKSTPKPIRKR
jgi:hypothetical protein